MIDSTFTWMVDTMIAVSLLIMVVIILRRPVTRFFGANAAYLLWLAPLARVLLPDLKILPAPDTAHAAQIPHAIEDAAFVPHHASGVPSPEIIATVQALEFGMIAFGVWVIGFIAFLFHYCTTHQKFQHTIQRNTVEPSTELRTLFNDALKRNKIRQRVSIKVATNKTGPLIMGVFSPSIIVPIGFEADFSPTEKKLALDHECAHLKHGDLIALSTALLLRAVFWPNPIIHYAHHLFRLDQEAACDERVINTNTNSPATVSAYASAILKSVSAPQSAPTTSLSMAHPIKERIKLMTSNKQKHARFGNIIAAAIIASGLAATANYTAQAEVSEATSTKEDKEKSSIRKSVITVDEDNEQITIDGWRDEPLRKIVFENRNGKRSIKAYNKKGKKVLDEKFEPSADMPYKGARIFEDGVEQSYISFTEDGGFKHPPHGDVPPPPPTVPEHGALHIDCISDGDASEKSVQVYSWTTDDDEGDHKVFTREVICGNALDADASPEERKASLQRAIDALEAEGERAQTRRKNMINELKQKINEIG